MADTLIQYAMEVPDKKRKGIVKIFQAASVILGLLFFIDLGDAMEYEYTKEAKLPGIGFRALNENYGASAKTEGAIVPVKEGTSIFGGEVTTDRLMLARKSSRVSAKVRAAGLCFDKWFFDSDSATNPKQFDGINKRLGTGSQTIKAATNGDYLNLDRLDELLDKVIGADEEKVLLMSSAMRRTLAQTLRAQGATKMALAEWSGNMRPKAYDNVKIVIMGEDHEGNEVLGFDETCGSYTTAGSIYCIAFGKSEDEDRLQGIARKAGDGVFEVEDQGVRNSLDLTLVEGRLGLAMFHGKSAARYYGIKQGVAPAE
jgi:hypothetical protein